MVALRKAKYTGTGGGTGDRQCPGRSLSSVTSVRNGPLHPAQCRGPPAPGVYQPETSACASDGPGPVSCAARPAPGTRPLHGSPNRGQACWSTAAFDRYGLFDRRSAPNAPLIDASVLFFWDGDRMMAVEVETEPTPSAITPQAPLSCGGRAFCQGCGGRRKTQRAADI